MQTSIPSLLPLPVNDAVMVGAGGDPGLRQGVRKAGLGQSLGPHFWPKRLLHKVTCTGGRREKGGGGQDISGERPALARDRIHTAPRLMPPSWCAWGGGKWCMRGMRNAWRMLLQGACHPPCARIRDAVAFDGAMCSMIGRLGSD